MAGNKNSGKKPLGPTIEVRTRIPEHYQDTLDKVATEYAVSRNDAAKILIIGALKDRIN